MSLSLRTNLQLSLKSISWMNIHVWTRGAIDKFIVLSDVKAKRFELFRFLPVSSLTKQPVHLSCLTTNASLAFTVIIPATSYCTKQINRAGVPTYITVTCTAVAFCIVLIVVFLFFFFFLSFFLLLFVCLFYDQGFS